MEELLTIYETSTRDARDVYSFVSAVISAMNTASGDCGGTGGSSVADISHKLVSPINPDRWVYDTDELKTHSCMCKTHS